MQEDGTGAQARPAGLSGSSTGQVQVGRYILDLPAPGGTTMSLAARATRTDPPSELFQELQRPPDEPPRHDFVDRLDGVLDRVEAVTDRIDRLTATCTAVLEGRLPGADVVVSDLVDSLALLRRLVDTKRFAEAVALARPLARVFALTLRWVGLVESLRLMLDAATALADPAPTAWAQHELGTLHGGVGDSDRARELLSKARDIRRRIGDRQGLAATEHNLRVLRRGAALPISPTTLVAVGVVFAALAVLAIAGPVGGGSNTAIEAGHSTATAAASTSTTSSFSSSRSVTAGGTSSSPAAAQAAVTPAKLVLTSPGIGLTGQPGTITIKNTGSATLIVRSDGTAETAATTFTVGADGCHAKTVAPDHSCTLQLTFTPVASGPQSATLTVTDNAADSPQQVALSAVVVAPPAVMLKPHELVFDAVTVGQTARRGIDLVNRGPGALTVTSATIDGSGKGDFSVAQDDCQNDTLPVGGACDVTIEFTPTSTGEAGDQLSFTDNAAPSTQIVPLSGNGVASTTTQTATSSSSTVTRQTTVP
jgi:Abnormal spindle-like microcephaly-assoc'd, ASPM-SPD-2-Hydin